MLIRALRNLPLNLEQQAMFLQILRYAVTGGAVTALGVGVYWILVHHVDVAPVLANFGAYLASMAVGYVAHSRFSFRGHGDRDAPVARTVRFVLVSLVSFALNTAFVWLLTDLLAGPDWWPIPAMIFVTPAVVFILNRKWVFT